MSCPRTQHSDKTRSRTRTFQPKGKPAKPLATLSLPTKKNQKQKQKNKTKAKQKKLLGISLINQLFLTYCIQVVSSQRFECTPVKCQQFSYTACLQEFHTRIYISSWLLHI